jgi:hypothetical protein
MHFLFFIESYSLGILACLDGFMNIAMEQTEEYFGGHLKARYGDCFIRGNNGNFAFLSCTLLSFYLLFTVAYISTSKTRR